MGWALGELSDAIGHFQRVDERLHTGSTIGALSEFTLGAIGPGLRIVALVEGAGTKDVVRDDHGESELRPQPAPQTRSARPCTIVSRGDVRTC